MMIARSIRSLGLAVPLLLTAGPFAAADSSDTAALRMAEAVPGFGGLFYDDKGNLNVYLLDTSRAGELRARPEMRAHKGAMRILEGQYDFRDLYRWRSELRSVLSQPGVVFLDIDERRNRIVVGVDEKQSEEAAGLVELERAASNAPPDAVIVEPMKPFKSMATLNDRLRPVPGGVQIAFSNSFCTLGFNANPTAAPSVHGFVTNSHCTAQPGGGTGTVYYQNTVNINNRIGVEVLDPPYFVGGPCPAGRNCRYSDSAFARYDAGAVEQDLGKIARPQTFGSLTVSTSAPFFQIVGTANFPIVGQVLNKVGRTTGWTRGPVIGTCADVTNSDNGNLLLCQDIVGTGSAGGDSGSPVFSAGIADGDTSAILYGILWGGDGSSFVMSSLENIQLELLPLTTFEPPPCTFSISPTSATYGAGGGTGTVQVTAGGGCAWTATSQADWISFPSGSSGSGNGTLSYAVAANIGSGQRTGTFTIADKTFTVTQDGVVCSYSIAPTSATVGSDGGSGSVSVTAASGCAWTASSQADWITVVTGASGSGNGTVGYSVASNPSSEGRTGTIVIAGRAFTIVQGGVACTYSISPSSASVGFGGGSGTVQVTAPPACPWTSASQAAWLSVSGTGNGPGSASYTVAANPGPARTGTLTIAGQTFTVTQAADPCPIVITPATAAFTSASAVANFNVTTPAGCNWEAVSNVPWVIPTLGRFGSGSATVQYNVQANPGGAREGRISVLGGSLRVTQDRNPVQRNVDRPQDGQTLTQPFDIAGWAIDLRAASGTGVDTLHNWAVPTAGGPAIFLGVSAYGGARPDVGALFGAQFTNSAFGLTVRGLPPGQYQLAVSPHSSVTGAFENTQVRTITAQANPGGHVDVPAGDVPVPLTFVVAGWAFDRAAASGSGIDAIHIYAYPGGTSSGAAPVFLGATTTTTDRPDVVAAFQDPQIIRCGYGAVVTVPAPGLYDVVVFARSTLTGQFTPYVKRVTAQ